MEGEFQPILGAKPEIALIRLFGEREGSAQGVRFPLVTEQPSTVHMSLRTGYRASPGIDSVLTEGGSGDSHTADNWKFDRRRGSEGRRRKTP